MRRHSKLWIPTSEVNKTHTIKMLHSKPKPAKVDFEKSPLSGANRLKSNMKYELMEWTRGWDERIEREKELQDKTRRDSFSGRGLIASFKRGQAALGSFAWNRRAVRASLCAAGTLTRQTRPVGWICETVHASFHSGSPCWRFHGFRLNMQT